jgi:peptidylprolyl isomerase
MPPKHDAMKPPSMDPGRAAESGDTVRVHYTGRLEDDSVFDTSDGREPLAFEVGSGDVIQGFDEGVVGMRAGQTKRVVIPPEEGYGPWRQELLTQVEREFARGQEVAPGMAVQFTTPDEELMEGVITEVTDESLTLDFNHPLAGKVLTFDITLVSVEPAAL